MIFPGKKKPEDAPAPERPHAWLDDIIRDSASPSWDPDTLPTSDNAAIHAPSGKEEVSRPWSACASAQVHPPTVTCEYCGLCMSSHLLAEHECRVGSEVEVDGMGKVHIYLHEWPGPSTYPSKGHHIPTPKQLAQAVAGLHPELRRRFREELYDILPRE